MVYQQANWIKALNVRENVSFPLTLLGISKHEAFNKAIKVLTDLGMANWAEYVPLELSSGQQQRVALARALINDPKVIVADEPTGNLDPETSEALMRLLVEINREGKTIVMATHDYMMIQQFPARKLICENHKITEAAIDNEEIDFEALLDG